MRTVSSDGDSNLYEGTIQNPVTMLKHNFLELYQKNLIYHKTSNFKFAITTNVNFWTWWFLPRNRRCGGTVEDSVAFHTSNTITEIYVPSVEMTIGGDMSKLLSHIYNI
jgi:hypothetical protein